MLDFFKRCFRGQRQEQAAAPAPMEGVLAPMPGPNETFKVIVASDVHGRLRDLRWILQNEKDVSALFFLGDGLYDLDRALELAGDARPKFPVYRVRGNCDVGAPDPVEGLAPVGGVLFFYTHGHYYNVKTEYDTLAEAAQNRGADVALFGHTHFQALKYQNMPGLPTLFNPGSVLSGGSYGVITIAGGKCRFGWKKVPQ